MQAIFWFLALRPLLIAVRGAHHGSSAIPWATTRSVTMRRLDAALTHSDGVHQKSQRQAKPFWSRNRVLVTVAAALAVAALGFGLYWMLAPAAVEVDKDELTIAVVSGEQTAAGFITILVTYEGNPVADALITLNTFEQAGLTNSSGRISFNLPEDNQVVIEAVRGELNGELVIDLG